MATVGILCIYLFVCMYLELIRTKQLCVLIHIRTKGEAGIVYLQPFSFFVWVLILYFSLLCFFLNFADRSNTVLLFVALFLIGV